MRLASLNRFWVGAVLGILALGVAAAIASGLILSGIWFNTAATSSHSKLFAWAIHITMIHSVERRSRGSAGSSRAANGSLLAGAAEYDRHCIACHGGPGVARAPWASAMLPTPPYLVGASGHWSRAELYTIIHDGVKMTGMPAWGEIEPDARIWDVVAFVEAMPKLAPDKFRNIREQARHQPDNR